MCQNADCGHVFVAGLEVLRTLSLSAIPAADVRIPLSQHVRQTAANQLTLALPIEPVAYMNTAKAAAPP